MPPFKSTPYDGRHPAVDPGNEWRNGTGIGGVLDRVTSYGNYAGLGNRNLTEGGYHPPIDGLDAAAERHDAAYERLSPTDDPFTSWAGIRAVSPADRALVGDVEAEMATHGSLYTDDAVAYSKGMRAFFGARAAGVDGIDWMDDKGAEVGTGVSSFVADASRWRGLGDAGAGLLDGIGRSAGWLGGAASEAWDGVSDTATSLGKLGPRASLDAAAGFANVATIGTGHLAGRAWDGVKSAASGIFGWLFP